MTVQRTVQGSLFAQDFLRDTIIESTAWQSLSDASILEIETKLRNLFSRFPITTSPNETQTEDDLIWPLLRILGWTASLRQQNLSTHGRDDVPDGLLFSDRNAKDRANGIAEEWKRYRQGLAIVESKRWDCPLDRRMGRLGEKTAPSTQMLRYLRRMDDLTHGYVRWGILTNGRYWRLYWQGALSVSEQFFEIDLATILDLSGYANSDFNIETAQSRHWLKVFVLMFRRDSFIPDVSDGRSFHQLALDNGRFYQERVANNLSDVVFDRVFPSIARAIAHTAPDALLANVREATLILLYRLLFILYAEDRDLLPVSDTRYGVYALREKVRIEIGRRMDNGDVFSDVTTRYWSAIDDLCRAIDQGDSSVGLPPYNGGLFDRQRTPLLSVMRLSDAVLANAIDAISFEETPLGRRYINYRDLGVQQLGSIYERLLQHEVVRKDTGISIQPNTFAKKNTGSYFTPDNLVSLIVSETLKPLVSKCVGRFESEVRRLESLKLEDDHRSIGRLKRLDPADKLLSLKICDPAMGSGHFLVNLVDQLTDHVISAMAEAEIAWEGYMSPLAARIEDIRNTIVENAANEKWTVDESRLDDRHIIRRMVLKRCVYGVDKNPMAVELAKVSLWLHTFTVGAPLSFLDHHLRCGDSLFGCWVEPSVRKALDQGGPIFLRNPVVRAARAAAQMQIIEGLTDSEIAEAHRSADIFVEIAQMTEPLNAFLSLFRAFEWMNIRDQKEKKAIKLWLGGQFGDPIAVSMGECNIDHKFEDAEHFAKLLETARSVVKDQRFLHWQVSFPGVWSKWEDDSGLHGGFDAVIGNPPWDKINLHQVEWFAARRPDIAKQPRAADRKRMVAKLEQEGDTLAQEFAVASEQSAAAVRMSRSTGDYPILSSGDVNLYSLFVERAMTLVKPNGIVGLLTPSGIASDKTTSKFFKQVATQGRLRTLYDFENKKVFFPDVHASFKFCVFIATPTPVDEPTDCAFYVHDISELQDPDRRFPLTAVDFERMNPNTGTAPIFRSRRDAGLTTNIYSRVPIFLDRTLGEPMKSWAVKYLRMFDMTNDSHRFRTRAELEENEGAWPIGPSTFDSPTGKWLPLYEGKMLQAYDHRAASIVVNLTNIHRPAQALPATTEEHQDLNWSPNPRFWVRATECEWVAKSRWVIGFKEITAPTNKRTFIAALCPAVGFGNKVPVLIPETPDRSEWLLAANFNSTIFDFVVRQKVQGQTLNLFIIEQLPVISPMRYTECRVGTKSIREIVREAVLELTYTSNDMAPFACDMNHVDEMGNVPAPFRWDEKRRLSLRAKLDALYFILYGVTNRDDVRYIYSTFPIVEREETRLYGSYISLNLCLAWINALIAGDPDANIDS